MSALPGDRLVLIASARENEAPDDVLAALERLPEGTEYQTVSEVWAALGQQERDNALVSGSSPDPVSTSGLMEVP